METVEVMSWSITTNSAFKCNAATANNELLRRRALMRIAMKLKDT